MYIAVVDGGGTAAKAVVFHEQGSALGSGRAGACNWSIDPDGAVETATASTAKALAIAGLTWTDLNHWVIGASGAGRCAEQNAFRAALQAQEQSKELEIEVWSDAHLAVVGALAGEPGAVVISGTGSIAMGRDAQGQWARAGGYGYIVGDEGSAFAIAVEALRYVLAADDGRQDMDLELRHAALEFFSVEDAQALIPLLYRQPIPRGSIARFSEVLAELAKGGHRASQAIFHRAGSDLATLLAAVLQRLHLDRTGSHASYLGGTFACGELLLAPFRNRLQELAPGCALKEPELPAVAGGLLMALPHPISKEVHSKLRQSTMAIDVR